MSSKKRVSYFYQTDEGHYYYGMPRPCCFTPTLIIRRHSIDQGLAIR